MNSSVGRLDEGGIVAWRDCVVQKLKRTRYKDVAEDVAQELAMKLLQRSRRGIPVKPPVFVSGIYLKEALRIAHLFLMGLPLSRVGFGNVRIDVREEGMEPFDLDAFMNHLFTAEQISKMIDLVRRGEFRRKKLAEASGIPDRTFRNKSKRFPENSNR